MPRKSVPMKERKMEITVTRQVTLREKVCPVCGKTFWGPKVRVYCSGRGGPCANRANYLKHEETRRKARLESYRKQKQQKAKG